MTQVKETPDRDEIAAMLHTRKLTVAQANAWADYLHGLPWRYIHPLVAIAINAHHEHPAAALLYAIEASSDQVFIDVATAHVKAKAEA